MEVLGVDGFYNRVYIIEANIGIKNYIYIECLSQSAFLQPVPLLPASCERVKNTEMCLSIFF